MGNIIEKLVKKVKISCRCISDCEISINKNSIKRKLQRENTNNNNNNNNNVNNNVNNNNLNNVNNVVVNSPNLNRPLPNIYTTLE